MARDWRQRRRAEKVVNSGDFSVLCHLSCLGNAGNLSTTILREFISAKWSCPEEFSFTLVFHRANRCLHTYADMMYIYTSTAAPHGAAPYSSGLVNEDSAAQCDSRTVTHAQVASQDELRRKLRRRGFAVTQATLSRDIHELRLSKGLEVILSPTAMAPHCSRGQ